MTSNLLTAEARGKARGKAEGKAEAALETAFKMKAANMPLESITKFTGLSLVEIEKL